MSNDVPGNEPNFLLYWGYFDLTPQRVTFSSAPEPDELRGLLVQHAFSAPGLTELDWNTVEFTPVPDPARLWRTALARLPLWTAKQTAQIRAFCRFEFIDWSGSVTADVDWIVIKRNEHWFYPSGEQVEPEVLKDLLSVSDFLAGFDIGPDSKRTWCVQAKLDGEFF